MKRKLLILFVFCLGIFNLVNAQEKKDYIIEDGVKYARVKTVKELRSLGVTVNGESDLEAASKRGKPKKGCSSGKGTCKTSVSSLDDGGDF
ncbi:MAG: hypothetical protein JST62_00385 [Bacteroidetes bacterium]|jgi:hypothetical protein|nr:hypothetical protein [Bacteroidota bacterium]